jgi:hypothetical protein
MTLKTLANQLCCVECDQTFDDKWHLSDGAECPNVSCPSHLHSALGDVLSQISTLNAQGAKAQPLVRALGAILPIRADREDAQDEAILHNLAALQRLIAQTIPAVRARVKSPALEAQIQQGIVNASSVDNAGRSLRMLGHELEGAIIDVEQGDGFDGVCLATMKRVRDALYGIAAAPGTA